MGLNLRLKDRNPVAGSLAGSLAGSPEWWPDSGARAILPGGQSRAAKVGRPQPGQALTRGVIPLKRSGFGTFDPDAGLRLRGLIWRLIRGMIRGMIWGASPDFPAGLPGTGLDRPEVRGGFAATRQI